MLVDEKESHRFINRQYVLRIDRHMLQCICLQINLRLISSLNSSLIPRPLTVVFSGLGMRLLLSIVKFQKLKVVNLTTQTKALRERLVHR